ncbi:ribose-5-phosphate isomerase RpiA [Hymenobacter tibetensis]|uniref:Ribose-5-phosphate isomerase A n=1 Tax=Hymenobacter tibetensis TaxID=497967 RepID=A0ABY4CV23_9BACT|nr:ribose-5-phosphate isomerase RpiA [Hymenobacter tibetensis]UOG73299.1 ribose-5-phosphate isomerase RpiA [Hymenobacter tibetensis]
MTPIQDKSHLDQEKQDAARAALRWVQDGMLVGLGTGSTAAHFIRQLGAKVQAGELRVQATATSLASENLARQLGIPLIEPRRGLRFNLTVDGADEVDPHLHLIKGGGGALLREKIIATASDYLLVIADSSKAVAQLGKFPLPLEVVSFALPWVLDAVAALGGNPVVRMSQQDPDKHAQSDQGNLLVDCHFGALNEVEQLARQLKTIPGIVEHGLFLGLARAALVVQHGQVQVLRPDAAPQAADSFAALP